MISERTVLGRNRGNSMNREETKKAIEVMQAYVDGAEIECMDHDTYTSRTKARDCGWEVPNHAGFPSWSFATTRYRIKSRTREFWIHPVYRDAVLSCFTGAERKPGTGYIKVREVL